MKKIWIASALCATILLMAGCSSSKTVVQQTTPQVSTQNSTNVASKGDLTLEELKKYDGQNGNSAGKDLTTEIGSAPHGKSVLANLTVIGKLK